MHICSVPNSCTYESQTAIFGVIPQFTVQFLRPVTRHWGLRVSECTNGSDHLSCTFHSELHHEQLFYINYCHRDLMLLPWYFWTHSVLYQPAVSAQAHFHQDNAGDGGSMFNSASFKQALGLLNLSFMCSPSRWILFYVWSCCTRGGRLNQVDDRNRISWSR